jgi:hydroxypyruvate reductase
MPDSSTVEDCYAIAQKYNMLPQFPSSVGELFRRRALEETPKSDDPAFQRSRWWPILSNAAVVKHAAEEARQLGFTVEVDNSCDDWDYERGVRVVNGGVGGRNQQLALAMSARIAGESITVLCAGTDGIDGNSPAAGVIADGSTLERAKARGLDLQAALARFNAFPFFDALGDTVITGPTGNNLRDLRILLAY